ncbi:MAG: sel1 repeat family protein [Emcibacteraceae bacterium]|nr:sel1 repeat family protein [Emcibacteraceae bacterium]
MNYIIKASLLLLILITAPTYAEDDTASSLYQQKKFTDAYPLFLKNAGAGDQSSFYTLGMMNQLGQGTEINIPQALKWYLKAIDAGNLDAAFMAGELYNANDTFILNYYEAELLYKLALNGGLLKAALPLGRLYTTNVNGVVHMPTAVKYLEIAALDPLGGDAAAEAASFLSQIYRGNGKSIIANERTAFKWLEVAAENGDAAAAAAVGLSCYSGDKVEKNPAKAFRFIRSAASRGHGIAQFNLGLFYYQGAGTRADPVKALAWFMVAKNTDPATDNGTIEKFKAALTPTKNKAAMKEYKNLMLRFSK